MQGSDGEDAVDAEPCSSSDWQSEGDDDMDVETAVAKARAAAEAIAFSSGRAVAAAGKETKASKVCLTGNTGISVSWVGFHLLQHACGQLGVLLGASVTVHIYWRVILPDCG